MASASKVCTLAAAAFAFASMSVPCVALKVDRDGEDAPESHIRHVGRHVTRRQLIRRKEAKRTAPLPAKLRRTALFTMTSPDDEFPLEPQVQHWFRQLALDTANDIKQFTILDNRPPDHPSSEQDEDLRRLQEPEDHRAAASVQKVQYSRLDDADYLARFFNVSHTANTGMTKPTLRTLMKQVEQQGARGYESVSMARSNFLGMIHVLEACQNAGDEVEMCVYLDPDIFIYRKFAARGILDAAPGVFAADPSLISVQPPTGCHPLNNSALNNACRSQPLGFNSQRYMVVNRKRLMAALPILVTPDWFSFTFEIVYSWGMKAAHNTSLGIMKCGFDTFVKHPPSRFNKGSTELDFTTLLASLSYYGGLDDTMDFHLMGKSVRARTARGQRVLIQRLEAGNVTWQLKGRADEDGHQNSICEDMNAVEERIAQGYAW